jgi:hypothetical protein
LANVKYTVKDLISGGKMKLEPVEKVPEELKHAEKYRLQGAEPLGMVVAKLLLATPAKAGKMSEEELKTIFKGRRLRLNGPKIRQMAGGKLHWAFDAATKQYYFWIE